jgi:lipopolysaccharide export system permease protein
LRDKYQKRSDVSRVEPGQFQESGNGDKVFFIDKDSSNKEQGINVFMVTREPGGIETVTSAERGTVQVVDGQKRLVLESGQRLEISLDSRESNFSTFERYSTNLGFDAPSVRNLGPARTMATIDLLFSPLPTAHGELVWRAGFFLSAINVIFLGLAVSGFNPRVGRASNLIFAFMVYLVYFNLLALGKNWVEAGELPALQLLLYLHGGVFALSLVWLAVRHNYWTVRIPARWRAGANQ